MILVYKCDDCGTIWAKRPGSPLRCPPPCGSKERESLGVIYDEAGSLGRCLNTIRRLRAELKKASEELELQRYSSCR